MPIQKAQKQRKSGRAGKIEDVAAATGVSIMTVSRAMRGVEGVSESKRAEILKAAKRLSYVPNSNARSLAVAHSDLIGISLPTFLDDVFADILEGMRSALDNAGFETVIDTTGYCERREEAWVDRMLAWHPAGVILGGVHHSPAVSASLKSARIPTLQTWDYTPDPIDICVGIDHFAAGGLAGSQLLERGYRRPGIVGVTRGRDLRAEARFAGFRDAFASAGVTDIPESRIDKHASFEAGMLGAQALLEQSRPVPDVLFFLSDHMAFGGLSACEAQDLRTPEDIGIMGFNGLGINTVLRRPLATIVSPRKQMGHLGARNLLARIHGVRTERHVALPVEFQPGGTLRSLPGESPVHD
ncbi:MAG: LacI family DNA-binding transcriptional regulator [Pseudomonadota bacterium]